MILFLPLNVLSSVTRQVMCGRAFRQKGFRVCFAGEGNYLDLARREGFEVHPLISPDTRRLLAWVRSFRSRIPSILQMFVSAWKEIDLDRFVQEEVRLFEALRPSLVISEERVSAVLSARIAGVPHGSLRNAYRTHYSLFPLADLTGSLVSRVIRDPLYAQRALLRFFSGPFLWRMNRILRNYQVGERLSFDQYVNADDLVFLCDVPEFSPAGVLPPSHHYVGPLFWKDGATRPHWLNQIRDGDRVLYVSFGSTGTPELMEAITKALERESYTLVLTTGWLLKEKLSFSDKPGIFVEEFLDPQPILERNALVICHAGNGTVYQALDSGVPLIAIPTHLEQRFNARRLVALGLGKHLEVKAVSSDPHLLCKTVEELFEDREIKRNVSRFQKRIKGFQAPETIVRLVEEFLGE